MSDCLTSDAPAWTLQTSDSQKLPQGDVLLLPGAPQTSDIQTLPQGDVWLLPGAHQTPDIQTLPQGGS